MRHVDGRPNGRAPREVLLLDGAERLDVSVLELQLAVVVAAQAEAPPEVERLLDVVEAAHISLLQRLVEAAADHAEAAHAAAQVDELQDEVGLAVRLLVLKHGRAVPQRAEARDARRLALLQLDLRA